MPTEAQPFSGGLLAPIEPSQSGGFKLLQGDDYITQVIQIHASDADSDNPFLDIGIGLEGVFANVSDQAWRGQIKRRMQQVFVNLQRANLAKLRSTTFQEGENEGEAAMTVRYLSLETQTELELTTTVRRG